VVVYDLLKNERIAKFTGHGDIVLGVAFCSPNTIVSGSHDRTLRCWAIPMEDESTPQKYSMSAAQQSTSVASANDDYYQTESSAPLLNFRSIINDVAEKVQKRRSEEIVSPPALEPERPQRVQTLSNDVSPFRSGHSSLSSLRDKVAHFLYAKYPKLGTFHS